LELVLIPAGQFVMGDAEGLADERPLARVRIDQPFWMGRFEVTNEQYARFDPSHDSRHEHGTASFNSLKAIGPLLNRPRQPVVRVSWKEATAFCDWLSQRSGLTATLPSEAQWEYACRAGTAAPFFYGDLDTDFSLWANMADATIASWATYNERRRSADQVPRDARFDDHALVTAEVGSFRPNAWGLCDVHGNVWEWTRSAYESYPYHDDDARSSPAGHGSRVVRGGSWYDRPKRCRSAFRLSYPAWQKVYNVGFRVVCEASELPDLAGNSGR
jgi:formylglycine-generating enzyme required for sulfatase activity